jgi:hypothetical protein
MTREEYRDMVSWGCEIISITRNILFTYGMDLAFAGELREAGEATVGEKLELPVDILTTMNDPVLLRIGETVNRIWPMFDTLKNINAFSDDESGPEDRTDEWGEGEKLPSFEVMYVKVLEEILDQLNTNSTSVYCILEELTKEDDFYMEIKHKERYVEPHYYKEDDDQNIRILAEFYELTSDLSDFIEDELIERRKKGLVMMNDKC